MDVNIPKGSFPITDDESATMELGFVLGKIIYSLPRETDGFIPTKPDRIIQGNTVKLLINLIEELADSGVLSMDSVARITSIEDIQDVTPKAIKECRYDGEE